MQVVISTAAGNDTSDRIFTRETEKCLRMEHEKDNAVECFAALCTYEPGYLCAEHIITAVTTLRGPETGIQVLTDLFENTSFQLNEFLQDGHQLAHIVGRTTAKRLGASGDIFNRCPTEFDYGCHHGFFEGVAMSGIPLLEIITRICDTFDDTERDRKTACFHAGGHGIMMSVSYDLEKGLLVCRNLANYSYQVQCEGGVFMENAMGMAGNRIPQENSSFSADNLLAPCEKIKSEKSSKLCYEFHHRIYLPSVYSTRAEDLVALCLSSENTESCLSGLAGAYTAAAGNIIVSDMLPEESPHRIERAGINCGAFPNEYRPMCYRFVYTRFLHNEVLPAKLLVQKICSGTDNLKNTCLSILEEEFAPAHRQN